MQKTVATIEKSKGHVVQIRLDRIEATHFVDVRIWKREGKDWLPTKQGVALSIWRLRELIDALKDAESEARIAGLFEEQAPRRLGGSPEAHRRTGKVNRKMDLAAAAAMDRDA